MALAQQARDARERLQMIGAGALRREQQKYDVYRLAVDGLEIDWLGKPREQMPTIRFSPANLPCGMAMPSPRPVEPSRSRWSSVSNT